MHWDQLIKAEHVRERLAKLADIRCLSFAGACVTHALERFSDDETLARLDHVTSANEAMQLFWSSFPPAAPAARRQVLLLEPLIPDDDADDKAAALPGRYDLVMATIFAHECAEQGGTGKAIDAAGHAYQAIV